MFIISVVNLLQTLKRTITPLSVPFSNHFVPLPKGFFHSWNISFRPQSVMFRSQSVPYKLFIWCKAFHPKRSEVFRSFHCHYQNGELTMKSKANFIYRVFGEQFFYFIHFDFFLWNCIDSHVNFEIELYLQNKASGVQL